MSLTAVLMTLAIGGVLYATFRSKLFARGVAAGNLLEASEELRPSLHILDTDGFKRLVAADPHCVLFHLRPAEGRSLDERDPEGISLDELEKCLRWVPAETKVVVLSRDGFASSLLSRLKKLHTRRELFLVAEVH